MLQLMRRMRENEEGFTLIELMVVVLIIAILIAIAIPTFLGAQDRARDRAAQSDLRNAFTAARSIATDFEGAFKTSSASCTSAGFAAALTTENASLTYAASTTALETGISVDVSDSATSTCDQLLLQRKSTSGKTFCLGATKGGLTFRQVNATGGSFASYSTCSTTQNGW